MKGYQLKVHLFFLAGGSLINVFAIKAIITAVKRNNAIMPIPIPAHPPIRKILIGIVNKHIISRMNPRFLSYFWVGNRVLMIKKRKSIKDEIANKRITIVQESFMKSLLSIVDNSNIYHRGGIVKIKKQSKVNWIAFLNTRLKNRSHCFFQHLNRVIEF